MQVELERNCLQGLERFMDAINGDEIDKVLQYFLSPRDIQEPVWTRWTTTVKAAVMVIDNWPQIYATLVAIKNYNACRRFKDKYERGKVIRMLYVAL